MNTSRSEQLYKTACGFMPGGVNSPVRACKAVGTVPLFIDHAKGQGYGTRTETSSSTMYAHGDRTFSVTAVSL